MPLPQHPLDRSRVAGVQGEPRREARADAEDRVDGSAAMQALDRLGSPRGKLLGDESVNMVIVDVELTVVHLHG